MKDPSNFPDTSGVITLIQNTWDDLKVWDHLAGAKDTLPKLRMVQIESPCLKKLLQHCAGRVPVLLQASLYRELELTFLTDVGNIISEGRITPDIGTGSLGQSDSFRFPPSLCLKDS